jgi:exonuclease VII large subunit
MDDDEKAAAMDKYQKALGDWQDKVMAVTDRLADQQARLGELQQKLNKLQTHDLPEAQRRDAEKAKKEIEDQQKAISSTVEKFDDRGRDTLQNEVRSQDLKAQLRAVTIKRETVEGSVLVRTLVRVEPQPLADANGREPNVTRMPMTPGAGLPLKDI